MLDPNPQKAEKEVCWAALALIHFYIMRARELVTRCHPAERIRGRRQRRECACAPQVVDALESEPGLAGGVAAQRVPMLVEHNPVIAVEVRRALWHTACVRLQRCGVSLWPTFRCGGRSTGDGRNTACGPACGAAGRASVQSKIMQGRGYQLLLAGPVCCRCVAQPAQHGLQLAHRRLPLVRRGASRDASCTIPQAPLVEGLGCTPGAPSIRRNLLRAPRLDRVKRARAAGAAAAAARRRRRRAPGGAGGHAAEPAQHGGGEPPDRCGRPAARAGARIHLQRHRVLPGRAGAPTPSMLVDYHECLRAQGVSCKSSMLPDCGAGSTGEPLQACVRMQNGATPASKCVPLRRTRACRTGWCGWCACSCRA